MEQREVIDKTIKYIEKNLEKKLTLDELADEMHYSKFHLNRMFSEHTGYTIHKYIQRKRLEAAAEQLEMSHEEITEIAYGSGYNSQQAFTYAFRQVYGVTPQAYRLKRKLHTEHGMIKSGTEASDWRWRIRSVAA